MNIIPPERFGKPEPPRPLTAQFPRHHNPGTGGRAAADHYPILSLHWPNLSTPQAPPSNHFGMAFSARRHRAVFLVACLKRVLKCQMRK